MWGAAAGSVMLILLVLLAPTRTSATTSIARPASQESLCSMNVSTEYAHVCGCRGDLDLSASIKNLRRSSFKTLMATPIYCRGTRTPIPRGQYFTIGNKHYEQSSLCNCFPCGDFFDGRCGCCRFRTGRNEASRPSLARRRVATRQGAGRHDVPAPHALATRI